MTRTRRGFLGLVVLVGVGVCAIPAAEADIRGASKNDRTLSPYFHIPGGDPDLDRLPLRSTDVEVSISGVIADVTVTQTYENDGDRPINARYVFPASTRAAVHGLTMVIGEHVIEAEVQERKQARREFEQARSEGKSASLLEQQRPNVFSMNVANVMPGDTIEVELEYTELLVPTDGVYELVYPTVVGPRYSEQPAATAASTETWIESPYLAESEEPTYTFDLDASITTGIPIRALTSPSHDVDVSWSGKDQARVGLDASESHGGNRDFVLRYRLAGEEVSSGLMLYEGDAEKFFLLMVQPPERVTPERIPPREYVFIVDVSGSMNGFPLDTAKELVKELTGKLRPIDEFNVMMFAGGSRLLSPRSLPATRENVESALEALDRAAGSGSTRLLSALQRAMALPHAEASSRNFVVITDGYISAEAEVFEHIKANLGQANVFSFGIGSGVNRYLVEGIARAGMGEPFVVTEASEARPVTERFIEYVGAPVLTNVQVKTNRFRLYDQAPMSVPDVLADRPIVIKGKWAGRPEGTITVSGISGNGSYSQSFDVSRTPVSTKRRALAYLWARTRIAELSDYASPDQKERAEEEITSLGLAYNLLTEHTSFVAVHDVVRNADGEATDVDQPLPLPQGVGNRAVGRPMAMGSEPELPWLVVLGLALAALLLVRQQRREGRSRR